jgi:membrane-associated phospholipid phosphatase
MSHPKLVKPDRRNPLVDIDARVSLALYRKIGSKIPRYVFKALEHTGSGLLWLPLAPVVFLAPSVSPLVRTCAANLLVGLLTDIVIVGTLKGLVQRARPVYNNADDFLLVVAVDSFSFPSGHAAR